VVIRKPFVITDPRAFFLQPAVPKQRQYEALRAYFLEGRPSQEVARAFGYSPASFRVLCSSFCHDPQRWRWTELIRFCLDKLIHLCRAGSGGSSFQVVGFFR
jgi:hypothetical protein